MKKSALMLLSGWGLTLLVGAWSPGSASAASPGDEGPSLFCPGDKKKPSACPGDKKKPSACPDDKKKPFSDRS